MTAELKTQARAIEQQLRDKGFPGSFSHVAANTIASLITALDAAEKDAARYWWYMENMQTVSIGFGDGWINADEPKADECCDCYAGNLFRRLTK